MTATMSWIAFGDRGVAKLVEAISVPGAGDGANARGTRTQLATLHSLLSNQESKMLCLAKDGAVVPVLTKLLDVPKHWALMDNLGHMMLPAGWEVQIQTRDARRGPGAPA